MTASILRPVVDLTNLISTTIVHPIYFPYFIAPSLHAARISVVYQNQVRLAGNQGKLSWPTYFAGYLIMAWGGTLLAHLLLSLPPPMFYSYHPWINYLSIHIFLTAFFHFFPALLNPKLIDTLMPLPDALLRTGSITSSLALIPRSLNPTVSNSIATQWIIGAVASSGGGQLAATFGVWKPLKDWNFLGMPVFLKGGVLATLDVWAGSLVALIYGVLTRSHPSYTPVLSFLASYHLNPQIILGSSTTYTKYPALMGKNEAEMSRAVITLLMTSLYAMRVGVIHWGLLRRWPGKGRKLGGNDGKAKNETQKKTTKERRKDK